MKSIHTLTSEHRLILEQLDNLSLARQRLVEGLWPPGAFFEGAVVFAREFADRFHHFKEEFLMFGLLAQKQEGRLDADIGALRYQHERWPAGDDGNRAGSAGLWLKKLHIDEHRDKKIDQLSKGNQQKVQLIAAIIHNPRLLILDEPFTGFDPINQQEVKDLILSFVSEGKTIILSTHLMDLAEKLCEDILLIDNGRAISSGNLADIKKNFGGNNIRISLQRHYHILKTFPEISKMEIYNNYAEIQLKQGIEPSFFLKKIIEFVDVNHFSIIEPSLNKIVIDLINQKQIDVQENNHNCKMGVPGEGENPGIYPFANYYTHRTGFSNNIAINYFS